MDIVDNELTKNQLFTLLRNLSFISSKMDKNDIYLFNQFWIICSGKPNAKAKINNIKLLLYSLKGIIDSFFYDELYKIKQNTTNNLVVILKDSIEITQRLGHSNNKENGISKRASESNSLDNKSEMGKIFDYDENNNLLLSLEDISVLKEKFKSFNCTRFFIQRKRKKANLLNCLITNRTANAKNFIKQINFNYLKNSQHTEKDWKQKNKFFKKFDKASRTQHDLCQKISNKKVRNIPILKHKEKSKNSAYFKGGTTHNFIYNLKAIKNIKEYKQKYEPAIYSSKWIDNLKILKMKKQSKQSKTLYVDRNVNQNECNYDFDSDSDSLKRKNSNPYSLIRENHDTEIMNLKKIEEIVKQRDGYQIKKNMCPDMQNNIDNKSSKFEDALSLRKFKDEFKVIREADKMISTLVNKYNTNFSETSNSIYKSCNHINLFETGNMKINSYRELNDLKNFDNSFKILEEEEYLNINKDKISQTIDSFGTSKRNNPLNNTGGNKTTDIKFQKITLNSSSFSKNKSIKLFASTYKNNDYNALVKG